ncbi:hypothetical protein QJQ45_004684 [Haematococcus lacustris]|nr:hypothetical protein QJQ45_004684 [Haematococcus lacustris]
MLYQAIKAGAWVQLRVSESILGPFLCLYQESKGPLRAQQVSGLVNLLVDAGLVHCSNRRSVRILYLRQAPPGSPPATTDKTYVSYVFKHTHQLSSPEDVAKYRQWLSHLSIVKSGDVKVGLLPAALCLRLQLPFARNYDWSAWVVTWRALPSLAQAAAQRQPNNIQVRLPAERCRATFNRSAILAHMLLNERLNMFGMLGCALCITGSMTIVLHAPEERVLGSVVEVWQLAMQPVFIGYIVFAVSTIVFLIWYVAPMHGTSNVFVYLGICSLAGSLSVMSCKALGIALKLTFQGDNQLVFVETHVCIAALDLYNTAIVSPVYYVMFTVLTIVASVIMFNDIQSPVQLATEACGFLTIVGGTFLLHSTRDLDVSLADLGRLTAAHKAAGQPDAAAWSASGAGPGQACVLMGALGSRERDKEKAEARDRLGMGNASRSPQGKQRQERRDGWTTRRRQVIKVLEGAVLRGCKKTRRKLRAHLQLLAEIHSQLGVIASLFALRSFLTARLAALAPAAPTGPPLPLDCEDPAMLRQLKDFCKFFANPNFKTVYNQLQRRLVRPRQHRHPMLMPAFEDPSNQALLAKLQELGSINLAGKGIAETREYVFDPDTQIGVGIDPRVTQAVSAASGVWDPATGQLMADQLRRWKLTKGQVKHASGLNNARRDTERWLAPIKPHLQHLAAASSAGTSLEANLKHITVTLATWDAVWEVYLDPKWAQQRLRLYGAQDRALEQFFKKLEEDMAEVSMERHGHAKQLVVFFGAARIGTRGGWGADAVLRACCKVVCRPRGAAQRRGRVVLVDEHRTTRVSSPVNGKQPCEEELNKLSATRPAGWKPPAGQVEQRLLRPAWSQQRDQPVRGMMWCPVVAPRKPPQAPRSSQAATPAAASDSEPGPSTPPPAKRSKRTEAEQAAEPTKGTGKGKGKAAKAKPAPQPGRWLDRDCNVALNMQRIGESRWRPLELCYWPEQGAVPAKGKEYPGLGYKRLRDKPPKAQQQQQPAVAQQCVPPPSELSSAYISACFVMPTLHDSPNESGNNVGGRRSCAMCTGFTPHSPITPFESGHYCPQVYSR